MRRRRIREDGPPLTAEQKGRVVDLVLTGQVLDLDRVAAAVDATVEEVRPFYDRLAPGTEQQIRDRVKSLILACLPDAVERLMETAKPADIMEILDRLDVLPKKSRSTDTAGPRVNVVVGWPGAETPDVKIAQTKES